MRARVLQRVLVRVGALAMVLAAVIAVVMPNPGGGRVALRSQRPSLSPVDAAAPARVRVADAASVERIGRFALNAFLSTLLDDVEPPAWSLVAPEHFCGPETFVEVDGKPIVPGASIPSVPFTVRWTMDACWPLGFTSSEASGVVEMLVVPSRDGASATVDTRRLWIGGASVPGAPFVASMSWSQAKR